jgi:hypothetical protein
VYAIPGPAQTFFKTKEKMNVTSMDFNAAKRANAVLRQAGRDLKAGV